MEDPVANAILNQYFRRLEQALSGLPSDRRAQIVEDLRAHVEESLHAAPEHSDATVLAILDRLGDPDEIAREALADEAAAGADASPANATPSASTSPATGGIHKGLRLAGPAVVALAVAVVVVLGLTGNRSSADPRKTAAKTHVAAGARLLVSRQTAAPASNNGWLPDADVSGGGGIDNEDCTPQTMSGSESASTLEAGATQVASGTTDGLSWSVWSKNGQTGATGIEEGGVVVDGVAYGMCPGFPNPAEMELLEPSGGGDGIAYGVIGYAGPGKVAIYQDTFGNFATGKLLASTTAQTVNGVGFFITPLSESGCDVPAVELNTASGNYATEHNLGFSTSDCTDGQLVPISNSQGIWQLPTTDFPNKFQSANGGGGGGAPTLNKNGWLPAADVSGGGGIDNSECGPQTLSGSEPASTLEAGATQVASGTTDGHSWSVWSKNGQTGATGIEDGGVVVDGVAYGMCPGFPNPSETELLEPSGGGDGLAYGVVGYAGTSKVAVYAGTVETFDTGQLLASTTAQQVNGVGFYITPLSESACGVSSLEINVAAANYASEHNLGFSTSDCTNGQLVPISWSQGIWQLPTSEFPNKFQSAGGGGALAGGGGGGLLNTTTAVPDSHKVAASLLKQFKVLRTAHVASKALPVMLGHMLSHIGARFGLDTSDVGEAHPAAGLTLWFIPGESGACVFEMETSGGGGSCGTLGNHPLGYGFSSGSRTTQMDLGFVPDGIVSVTAHVAGGAEVHAPVVDNAYVLKVTRGGRLSDISGVNAAGKVVTRTG